MKQIKHGLHHNDTQHNDAQHNGEHCYAECQICSVSFMLSGTNKPLMMLSVVMLSVVAPGTTPIVELHMGKLLPFPYWIMIKVSVSI
jgi:hypothetical protein